MDAHSLMRKLMEIERALPTRDDCAIRNMLIEAQNGVLQLEHENEELALHNASLRLRLRGVHNSTLPLVAQGLGAGGPDHERDSCEGRCADHASRVPGDASENGTWRTTHFFFS
ncbi:MAG TPA: hypothetical protein VHZ25_12085 [Acidobacteriaceae bacterium]|jgi:hypothetical protein|nr:hypothetical protein [Acidobacteriaceae bacterium]